VLLSSLSDEQLPKIKATARALKINFFIVKVFVLIVLIFLTKLLFKLFSLINLILLKYY
jgi:hypothetical protein